MPDWVLGRCARAAAAVSPREAPARLCAVGVGPKHPNPQAALETALARARAELGRQVEVRIEDWVRVEHAGDEARLTHALTHQLSSARLAALRVDEVWIGPDGRPHVRVSMPAPTLDAGRSAAAPSAIPAPIP